MIKNHPENLEKVNIGDNFVWRFVIKTELMLPEKIPIWVIDKSTG